MKATVRQEIVMTLAVHYAGAQRTFAVIIPDRFPFTWNLTSGGAGERLHGA